MNVLDNGCGNGWAAMLLATKAGRVAALDFSFQQIRVLQKYVKENRFSNITYAVAKGSHIPFADESFHYVFGNAILHHLTLEQCLPEVARIIKPGGRAAFCEPFEQCHFMNFFMSINPLFSKDKTGRQRPIRYSERAAFRKYFSAFSLPGYAVQAACFLQR